MADEKLVKAFMLHNVPRNGQVLFAGGVYELPQDEATALRDRGAVRKATKEEVDTLFQAPAKTVPFGEEKDEKAAAGSAKQ